MALHPLRVALEKKYSSRHVDRLVANKVNESFVTRHQALLAVARENKLTWARYASEEDLAALRGHGNGAKAPAPASLALPSRTRPTGRGTATKTPVGRRPRDRVFVVHGRDTAIRDSMFAFLRAIGLEPIEWGEALKATGKAMPSIPDALHAGLGDATAVVVILTPDDLVTLKPRLLKRGDPEEERRPMGQARPNVLFEGGMALGRYPDRTVIVSVGRVKAFSDISGLHIIRMDDGPAKRNDLAESLGRAGADVKTDGKSDWYREGKFELEEDDDGSTQAT